MLTDAARHLAGLSVVLFLSGCVAMGLVVPSHDRDWQDAHSRLTSAAWKSDTEFTMFNIRNWGADERGPTIKEWVDRRYDLGDVQAIWFFVEPFQYVPCLAHTFLTFEFGEGEAREFVSVSVEARKEVGEDYSPLDGMFGGFELIFVWSTEKDILADTVIHLGHDLRAYKANVTPEQAQLILRGFVNRTNEIARKPEFYHTLQSNCTTELAAVINRELNTPIPPDPSFVLTGSAARYLHSLGFVGDPETPFETLRAKADIVGLVREHRDLPERAFSIAIRRALAARLAAEPNGEG